MNILERLKHRNKNLFNGWPTIMWDQDSYALIVYRGRTGSVIEHSGAHIDTEIDSMGSHVDDLGLVPPADGLWVWKGRYKTFECHTPDGYDFDSEPKGTFRNLTEIEIRKLALGQDIFEKPFVGPEDAEAIREALDRGAEAFRQVLKTLRERDIPAETIEELYDYVKDEQALSLQEYLQTV